MRKTGKFYTLTLISAVFSIVSNVLLVLWSNKTSSFNLWLDPILHGLGMASVITTTLIVSSNYLIAAVIC